MSAKSLSRPCFARTLALVLLVTALGAATLITPSKARAASSPGEPTTPDLKNTPERIIALNWSATESLLLLGVTPVGVADRDGYPEWVKEPALPDSASNVGRRSAPSPSAIAELKPDLIVASSQLAPAKEQMERIAPAYFARVYTGDKAPFEEARDMLLTLGDMLDRKERAEKVLKDVQQSLAKNRARLEKAGLTDKPIALMGFMDDRHVRVNAPNGLFQTALDGLGLKNAWQKPGNNWGFSLIGLDKLAGLKDARLVAVAPIPGTVKKSLRNSPFWHSLPAVQQKEVYQVDTVWTFGGVYAVKRMGQELTDALLGDGQANVR